MRRHQAHKPLPFSQRVAVVTGAGSGLGRALAVALSDHGARLALTDKDEAGLRETSAVCRTTPRYDVVDVTDAAAVQAHADQVADHHGGVDLLINCAGIIHAGGIEHTSLDEMAAVMDVDFWGVVHGTKAFLPYLIGSEAGHLVNVSSAFGLIAAPSYAGYNAAKFAVRGFTEAVRQDMLAAGQPVRVSCVYPGGIRTEIMRNATMSSDVDADAYRRVFDAHVARTDPQKAAAIILRGIQAGRPRILVGPDAHLADLLARGTGARYHELLHVLQTAHRRRSRTPSI